MRWWRTQVRAAAWLLLATALAGAAPEQLGPPAPLDLPKLPGAPTTLATPDAAPPPPGAESAPKTMTLGKRQMQMRCRYVWFDYAHRVLTAERDIEVKSKDLTLTCTKLALELDKHVYTAYGPLEFKRPDGLWLRSQELRGDVDHDKYSTGPFTAQIPPAGIGYGVVQPINVKGASARADLPNYFEARQALATGCPLTDLKYHLKAKSFEAIPDKQLTLRHATAYVFGIPVAYIGKLVLPIRKRPRRYKWLPEVGRNDIDGWYALERYLYGSRHQEGSVSAKVTQLRGWFFGGDEKVNYGGRNWRGELGGNLDYGLKYGDTALRTDLNQQLGPGTTLRADYSTSRNTGYSSQASQDNLSTQFATKYALGSTTIGLTRSGSANAGYTSTSDRVQFDQQVTLGPEFSMGVGLDFAGRQQTGSRADDQIDTRARFSGQLKAFDWEVLDQRKFYLSPTATTGGFGTTEIVPQVTLRTDARRLKLGVPDFLDLRVDTSVGEYRENSIRPDGTSGGLSTTLRGNLNVNTALTRWWLGRHAFITADGNYSQSIYDHPSPSAKYTVALGPMLQLQPLPNQRFDIRYRWQRVDGFSPLSRFDFATATSDLDFTWNAFVPDRARPRTGYLSSTWNTGFDLRTGLWRDVRVDLRANPLDELGLVVGTSYSLEGRGANDAGLREVRCQVLVDTGRAWRSDLGFTYSPRTGRWGQISHLLRLMPLSRVTLQDALSYDTLSKKVVYHDVQGTYDMGCVALVGFYHQQTGEFGLNLNLAAFPALGSTFGTGRYGQSFSTSQGIAF